MSALAFTPDGQRVLTVSRLETGIRQWDAQTGESRGVLGGHGSDLLDFTLSPDGKRLASASWDRTVRLWDLETGQSRVLSGHTAEVVQVTFSPDGRRVLSASADGTARLWPDDLPLDRTALRTWLDQVETRQPRRETMTPMHANAPSLSPLPHPLIVGLDALGRADLPIAGGKGANLGELIQAGFRVPPGFVVTTAAYARVLDESGAGKLLANRDADLTRLATELHERLARASLPADVWEAVVTAYRALGSGPVAVRSSGTAEDLPGATFAGQHDTLLNVEGEEALERALRECWASLWTDRAASYRQRQGIDPSRVSLALVVQRMVKADAAGVMFTADPISFDRGRVMIEAAPGLGEAVVSGTVTPDQLVLDKASLAVLSRKRGRHERDALTDEQARQLAMLALAVERHFGSPQDVEWALGEGTLFLLQARPMTALPAPKPQVPARKPSRRDFSTALAGELFPIRPYPLDVSSFTTVMLTAIYENLFTPLGAKFAGTDQLFVQEDGVVLRLDQFGPSPSWRMLYRPWLSIWRARKYPLSTWEQDPIVTEGFRKARELRARDLRSLSWEQVIATAEEALALGQAVAKVRGRYFPKAILRMLGFLALLAITGRFRSREALLSGIETKTLQLNRELEALAAKVRADPKLRQAFSTLTAKELVERLRTPDFAPELSRAFEAFLDAYGSRESTVTLASQPGWWNAPEIPLSIIQGLAAREPSPHGDELSTRWMRARDELLETSWLGREPLRSLFLRALPVARSLHTLRENSHFYLLLGQAPLHACFNELGRRLAEAGALEAPQDVFHLLWSELRSAWPLDPERAQALRAAAERRKKKREMLDSQFVPPLAHEKDVTGALVAGNPASAGVAEGPVRIILGPKDFGRLQQGDILVCPFTNPAWTPLFQSAAAVVADTGGTSSHAAIVAREYGIPAVMATGHGTRRLVDGQRVRVDGTLGRVYASAP